MTRLNPGAEREDCCWVCGARATHVHRLTGDLTCDEHAAADIDNVPLGGGEEHV